MHWNIWWNLPRPYLLQFCFSFPAYWAPFIFWYFISGKNALWLYYLLRRKRKQGRQLVKYCFIFFCSVIPPLSAFAAQSPSDKTRVATGMLPLFLFVYTFGIINRLAGTVETTDIYEKEYIAPNERNSSFVKGPETRLSLAGVYGRRLQKRQRTKPATAAVRAAGTKQQISRLQALYMPMQRFPP